jgi:drug/metabolite transporter (DMT)-like permease
MALSGFAANSLLCRSALGSHAIDAWSFTAARIASGALALTVITNLAGPRGARARGAGSLGSAFALWVYAASFSLAYLRLGASVGALVLFTSVQATMLGWSTWRGVRPSALELRGLALAFLGLVVLTLPGASLPDPLGLALMVLAGAGWGAYSLRGRGSRAPLLATADNFTRAAPFAVGASLAALAFSSLHVSLRGLALACASGALASGLGYSLWYRALPELSAVRAALVQLVVPVLTALFAFVLLEEVPNARLLVAGPLILFGVGWAVFEGRPR